jgi:DNA repair exonuclease SbcCD ATPase subunit
MDDIENILGCLKPKDFTKAAAIRREKIVTDQQRHEAQENLLVARREQAQTQARAHKFLNKDFSSAGLKTAYAALGEQLRALAGKYEVELEPLPPCLSTGRAREVSSKVAAALRTLRTHSKPQAQLAPISKDIGNYTHLAESMEAAVAKRSQLQEQRNAWVSEHGEHKVLTKRRKTAQSTLDARREALKAAGQLRQLLADARMYLEIKPSNNCPVCEQSVPSASHLISELTLRLDTLASQEISELEAAAISAKDALEEIDTALTAFDEHEQQLQAAQQAVDDVRGRVVAALGGQGIPEAKVNAKLAEALKALEIKRSELTTGAASMEEDLAAVEEEDRRIKDYLVPVLEAREALMQLEDDWNNTKQSHAEAESAAGGLESVADQLTRLRTALLEAKNELASSTLSGASPRANELYQRLVRHPVFDALEITTAPKANKIDYSFEVSSRGEKATAREARLVLSDGQVTATAIGLFFAFSDAETHNLDLLYVDDPTQNLDLPCKEAMAKVVTELAQRRQVVVSTQDEDFVSYLESEGFFDLAVVYHLERWDGNPIIKTAKMRAGRRGH